ncbi:MAG TPA: hypothetical protein VK025_01345 [Steroidobacter sp.]|jgi:hypothetical protein|nr:hypothetical protein [Steroidobacteraceae bacterium]HLS80031.1 hypothetical protein [Steroidobacter sp.]
MTAGSARISASVFPKWLSPYVHGRQPLWRVFWVYGVLCSHLMFGAILLAYAHVDSFSMGLMLVGFLGYSLLICRLVWVNADNVGNPLYGQIAKGMTIAWVINASLISAFLLLAHLADQSLSFA